ncbi:MAG: hypothetical protein JWN32_2821 [Solirubrobacterales bacterium]|nr:hypothetical protein [Solirubrobacterales bacterium]
MVARRMNRLGGILGAVLVASALGAGAARAVTPYTDIASGGPLTHVYVGNELSCQISYAGDAAFELYPSRNVPGDCGTLVSLDGVLYAPDFTGHGSSAASGVGVTTAFTPESQTAVTGTGTAASPFRVTTVVRLGATGVQITQIDSYVAGQESYRTDVTVQNTGAAPKHLLVYRAGDCYLQGSDVGFGFTEAPSAVGCSKNANNQPAGRIEEWFPITGGNHYYQAGFSEVWRAIAAQTELPNTCRCTESIDQGAAISWALDVPAGGSRTVAHYTRFSPSGTIGQPPSVAPPGSSGGGDPNNSVTPGQVFSLPSNHRCISKRNFRIRLKRPNGVTLISAIVKVNGRQVTVTIRKVGRFRTISGRALTVKRLTAQVDLRGLPRGTFRVEIRAATATLKILKGVRTYHTCTKHLKGGSPKL